MIKYQFLDVGLAYRPQRKLGGELLLPAAIVGGAGLFSSIFGASSARSNNEKSMEFTAAANQQQMDFAREMYARQLGDTMSAEARTNAEYNRRQQLGVDSAKEMTKWIYENYNSPAAQAKAMRAAGFNPAMILGGSSGFGASPASVPSPSSPSVNYPSPLGVSLHGAPSLENEGAILGQGLESMSRSVASMVQAGKGSEETERLRETHDLYVQTVMVEKLSKQTAAEHMQLQLELDKLNLPKKQSFELKKLYADFSNATLFGELTHAQTIYTDMQTKLSELLAKKYSIELDTYRQQLELHMQHTAADIALKASQKNAVKASAAESYAAAGKYTAETKTINSLREFQTDLAKWDANLAKQAHGQHDALFPAQLRKIANEANSSEYMPDMVKEELRAAVKNNDWFVVRQILGIANSAVGAYATYKGAKTGEGFVNAQDVRNQIQGDWVEWQKSRGKTYEIHGFE